MSDDTYKQIYEETTIRGLSILDPETLDIYEAYCDRHSCDMETIIPMLHKQGAIYTTKDPFKVFYCDHCLGELGRVIGRKSGIPTDKAKNNIFNQLMAEMFEEWDNGGAPADWFTYVSDGDMDNGMITFE